MGYYRFSRNSSAANSEFTRCTPVWKTPKEAQYANSPSLCNEKLTNKRNTPLSKTSTGAYYAKSRNSNSGKSGFMHNTLF